MFSESHAPEDCLAQRLKDIWIDADALRGVIARNSVGICLDKAALATVDHGYATRS